MLDRMHNAKVANDELKNFYAARAAIEDEYARKLLNLSRKPLGSAESGTLRLSCDVIRTETESMGKAHQNIAQQMKTELEEPLAAFAGGMKERRKIVQNGIEKLLKLKMQQTSTVNKSRDRYEQDCLKIKGFLAQAHMVMGHEERKNKAKLEKTQINLSTTSSEYEAAVKMLEETTGRWNRDWKAACDVRTTMRLWGWRLTVTRNSKISRKSASTTPRAASGTLPTSPQQYASVMTPRARRCVFRWRTVTWRKISQASSRTWAQARKYQTRQNSSTSVEETPKRRRKRQRTRTTPLRSLHGL
jgi:hypothetical protein